MYQFRYFFLSLFFISLLMNPVAILANEICELKIEKKQVLLKSCNDKKIVKKNKLILKIQLQQSLLFTSDFESIIKNVKISSPIYRFQALPYRQKVQKIQWDRAREKLEKLSSFITTLSLPKRQALELNEAISKLKKDLLLKEDFMNWQQRYNLSALNVLQIFLSTSVAYSKEMIGKNIILTDILTSRYWNPNLDWKMDWVKIPTGKAILGASKNQQGHFEDELEYLFENRNSFEMAKTPVTQLQWVQVMGSNPSLFKNYFHCPKEHKVLGGDEVCPSHPVENVSVEDIFEYLSILSTVDPYLKLRLPSVQEWEFSAKAFSKNLFWFGSKFEDVGKYCWEESISNQQTQPVASKPLNPFGLSDVCGNVWQVTTDKNKFFLKGGSWTGGPRILRHATKRSIENFKKYSNVGFRLVK